MKRKIVFILNPHSGTDDKVRMPKLIEENINTTAYDYDIVFTEYAGHAADIAQDCASRGIDIGTELGTNALQPVKKGLPREVLSSVEAHMLKEVRKSVLVRGFLDSADIGGKVKFSPVSRFFVVSDEIGQAVFQFSGSDRRVNRQLLGHLLTPTQCCGEKSCRKK